MVFLHRQGSLRPFTRHYPTEDVFDLLQLKDMPDGSTQVQGWLFLDFFFFCWKTYFLEIIRDLVARYQI